MKQRTKNILLTASFLLLLLLVWKLVIARTFDLKNEIDELKAEGIDGNSLAQVLANLNAREQNADRLLEEYEIKNISAQNNLLEFLNQQAAAHNFEILEFLEPHIIREAQMTTTSYRFTLKGDYIVLEHILYQLEQKNRFGSISHVHFEKKKNYRTQQNYLLCSFIIERLGSN